MCLLCFAGSKLINHQLLHFVSINLSLSLSLRGDLSVVNAKNYYEIERSSL